MYVRLNAETACNLDICVTRMDNGNVFWRRERDRWCYEGRDDWGMYEGRMFMMRAAEKHTSKLSVAREACRNLNPSRLTVTLPLLFSSAIWWPVFLFLPLHCRATDHAHTTSMWCAQILAGNMFIKEVLETKIDRRILWHEASQSGNSNRNVVRWT